MKVVWEKNSRVEELIGTGKINPEMFGLKRLGLLFILRANIIQS